MSKAAAKKKRDEEDDFELTTAERKVFLQRQIEKAEHAIMMEQHKTVEAEKDIITLRTKLAKMYAEYEEEKEHTFEMAAGMTRRYRTMRARLTKELEGLEAAIAVFKDNLEQSREEAEEANAEKNRIIAAKDAEIADQKRRMDEMSHEFGQMLKATLGKMSEKIVITNPTPSGYSGPVVKSFEDFNLMKI